MNQNHQLILDTIAQAIFDKKGINILVLDLRGISTIADFVVIAEGNVDRHVIAIGHAVEQVLKEQGIRPVHVEGMPSGDWVVLDYLQIMVHIFMPGMRDKYQLETLWKEGKIVDVHIDVHHPQASALV
jgi:ribosome-associated protein